VMSRSPIFRTAGSAVAVCVVCRDESAIGPSGWGKAKEMTPI
jgi:hypothetical protein